MRKDAVVGDTNKCRGCQENSLKFKLGTESRVGHCIPIFINNNSINMFG